MKTNKFDKDIKEKFDNRTFKPSDSAWERLSMQLDEQSKEKQKGWFFYIGIAASILLLVSIGIQIFYDKTETKLHKEVFVNTSIDTVLINNRINKMFDEVPVEEAWVKNNNVEDKNTVITKIVKQPQGKSNTVTKTKVISNSNNTNRTSTIIAEVKDNTKNTIVKESLSKEKEIKIFKRNPKSRIKINSDDLLFAVTHSSQEVKDYYAKHNINRKEVLKTIKDELKKSSIIINPETILAEVERTIDNDDFQNNFMKSLKTKISNIATVIASRNN